MSGLFFAKAILNRPVCKQYHIIKAHRQRNVNRSELTAQTNLEMHVFGGVGGAFSQKHPRRTVEVEKFVEVVDLFGDAFAVVGVFDHDAVFLGLDVLGGGFDVDVFCEGFFDAFKGLVGFDAQTVGIVDQSVACNACFAVVVFAEAAVDHKKPAVCFDGLLAAGCQYGGVSVDDVRGF